MEGGGEDRERGPERGGTGERQRERETESKREEGRREEGEETEGLGDGKYQQGV